MKLNGNGSSSQGVYGREKASPIAVIGIGCLFPRADGPGAYWSNIKAGLDAITEVPSSHWRREDYFDADPKAPDRVYSARGGFLSPIEINPLDLGISPHTLEATDSTQLLGLVVAREALRDAGYPTTRIHDRNRVSVILGVTGTLELVIPLGARLGHPIWRRALKDSGVPSEVAEDVVARISESYVPWQENSFPGLLGNVAAGRIANRLDLGGTNCVVDAACASSLSAIHLAALELSTGRCDLAVSGGLDTFNDIFMYMCFSKTPALSPTGHARPFDASSDGTTLGEGLGVVVLKRLEDARRDGDRIYAVIRGIGTSSDGKGNAIYAPSASGQSKALRAAYDLASVSPATVELVEAHGTGTKVGDVTEATALGEVYRAARAEGTWCALGSVKSQIGHTKAAAGAAGLIKAVLALHAKVLPPTSKVARPVDPLAPGRSPFYVNTSPRPWLPRVGHPRRAAVSAFGFGGSNFHCVLEEAASEKTAPDWDANVQVLAFSADSPTELVRKLESFPASTARSAPGAFRAASAAARAAFDPTRPVRLGLAIDREAHDLERMLRGLVSQVSSRGGEARWATPEGAFYVNRPAQARGKLVFLFPGQGAQRTGMLRELVCLFPEALVALAEADTSFAGGAEAEPGQRLSDRIYPVNLFTEEEKAAAEAALRDTTVAQPALGAVNLAAFRVLNRFGVQPDAAAGHSFGELVALHAAGWIDAPALLRLAALRGRLMAAGAGDRGAMLAVGAPLREVDRIVAEHGRGLVVANRNAPEQGVVSGPTAEVEALQARLEARGLRSKRLPVSGAFHSALVAGAARPLAEALRSVVFTPSSIPVYSNTLAGPYPADPERSRAILSSHLSNPVDFEGEVRALHAGGARTFLEVGPSNKLTGLVGSILGKEEHTAFALEASGGRSSSVLDLARALGTLAALGHPVRLTRWDEGFEAQVPPAPRPGMTVRLTGANYMRPRDPRSPSSVSLVREDALSSSAAAAPAPGGEEHAAAPASAAVPTVERPQAALPSSSAAHIEEGIAALIRIQEQTAELHRKFLEGQGAAQRAIQLLLEGRDPGRTDRPVPAPPRAEPPESLTPPRSVALPAAPPERELLPAARAAAPPLPAPAEAATAPPPPSPPAERPGPAPRGTPDEEVRLHRALAPEVAPAPATEPSPEVARTLLDVVAEKTGYPSEMLSLDMSLEGDLGIDSIKRVEILSTLRERLPGAPEISPAELPQLATLRAIALHLGPGAQGAAPAAGKRAADPGEIVPPRAEPPAPERLEREPSPAAVSPAPAPSGVAPATEAALLSVVSEKTGYPAEMLNLDMSLEGDLGIDSIKRVEILSALRERLPGAPEISPAELPQLGTLRAIAERVGPGPSSPPALPRAGEHPPAGSAPSMAATPAAGPASSPPGCSASARRAPSLDRHVLRLERLPESRPLARPLPRGELWVTGSVPLVRQLAALLRARGILAVPLTNDDALERQVPADLAGLVAIAPETGGTGERETRELVLLLARTSAALRKGGPDCPALVAAVTRIDGALGLSGRAPAPGAIAGAGLGGVVKTVAREWPEVRARVIDLDPSFADPLDAAERLLGELELEAPLELGLSQAGPSGIRLEPRALEASGLARPPCGPGETIVVTGGARGVTAECALALATAWRVNLLLLGRSPTPAPEPADLAACVEEGNLRRAVLARRGGRATPREVEDEVRRLLAERAVRTTLLRLAATGARVIYRQVDVMISGALSGALDEARATLGPIRGIVHGAGVLADRKIEEKTAEQVHQVFATKVDGLENLLAATARDDLKVLALFSSTTGRLGRAGQVDYAAANEALNKIARREAALRPGCRVASLNWGPWRGGMVHAGLEKLFAEEGVALLPIEDGAAHLVRELEEPPPGEVEVAVLGPGSRLPPDAFGSGNEPARGAVQTTGAHATAAPLLRPAQPTRAAHTAFRLDLNVDGYPFLASHVLGGKAVLPVAVIMDWLAQGALHDHPGLAFRGLDDLKILKGVILGPSDTAPLHVATGAPEPADDGDDALRVPVELWNGAPGQGRLHARAQVLLGNELPPPPRFVTEPALRGAPSAGGIYDGTRLFHGRDFQALERIEGTGEQGIAAVARLSPPPSAWIKRPLRGSWIADPLALDAAFQLLILWCHERRGMGCLPSAVGSYRQFQRTFPRGQVRVVVRVTRQDGPTIEADAFFHGPDREIVARLERIESVADASLEAAFTRNRIGP